MSRFARAHATRAAQVRASRACRMARRLPGQRTVNGRSLAAALLVALTGCAGAGSSGGSLPAGTGTAGVTGPGSGTAGSGLGPGTAGSGGGAGGTGGSPLPPEMELESSYEIPVATGHFIWVANPPATEGYQDLTVIDLHADPQSAIAKTIVAAGFRPVSIAFAADGTRAFAVTEDGITVIALGGGAARVTKNVIVTDDPTEDA